MSEVPLYTLNPPFRTCNPVRSGASQREFFIDNLLVRIHFIIVMIRWTGLAQWEFEFRFPGNLTSTFLVLHLQSRQVRRGPVTETHLVFWRARI